MCKSNDTGISLSCLLSICFDLSVCLFLLHHMSSLAMSEFLYFYSIQCRTYYLIINYACWYVLVCMCVTMNTFPDVLVQTAMLELLLTLLFFDIWLWKSFTCVLLNKYILTEGNSFLASIIFIPEISCLASSSLARFFFLTSQIWLTHLSWYYGILKCPVVQHFKISYIWECVITVLWILIICAFY